MLSRAVFCKKSGILLISEPLPNSDAKGLGTSRWNVIGQLCGSLLGQGMTEVREDLEC
jgi:hypothetical protein